MGIISTRNTLWTAAFLAAMTLGGCARVTAVWEAATQPFTEFNPPAPKPDTVAVAQGEEASGELPPPPPPAPPAIAKFSEPVGLQQVAGGTKNDWRAIGQGTRLEPVHVPVVNVFGELDGRQNNAPQGAADFGFQQHTVSDEGYDADVTADPTGKWLAFASTRHAEKTDIYLQRADGASVTQLTSDPADDAQPVFSPDGRSIAFCSSRAGSWDLYTMDLDGRNVTQVTSGPAQDMHPSFSPDGRRLVYCSIGSRSGQWELWIVDLVTHEKRMIGYGLFPAWCPEKGTDRIAYQRGRQRGSRWFSLWTLDLVDGEARKITEVAVSSNAAIICPTWSPDGKRLAFTTVVEPVSRELTPTERAAGKRLVEKPRSQQDIWVVDSDGASRHRLTDGTGINLSPHWAADGRVYFISDRGGHENIWSARIEAGASNLPMARGHKNENRAKSASGVDSKTTVGSSDPSETEK